LNTRTDPPGQTSTSSRDWAEDAGRGDHRCPRAAGGKAKAPLLSRQRYLLTVHDALFRDHPEW